MATNSTLSWNAQVVSNDDYKEPNEKLTDVIKNGVLHIAPSLSAQPYGYYWSSFTLPLSQKFDGDNFKFEIRAKNTEVEGGLSAYDVGLSFASSVVATNSAGASFMGEDWAIDYTGISALGKGQNNFKGMVVPLSDWHTLGVETKNQKVITYYDGKQVGEYSYTGKIGEIDSLAISTKGSGSVDWAKATSNGALVLEDNFDKTSTSLIAAANSNGSNANDVYTYNGHTYQLSNAGTWKEAQAEAKSLGGNLVTINDKAENDWLVKTFENGDLWIGYTDEQTEGTFKWVDGSSSNYTNWYTGEPNDANGGEDYGMLWPSSNGTNDTNGKWNDSPLLWDGLGIIKQGIIEISNAPAIIIPKNNPPTGEITIKGETTEKQALSVQNTLNDADGLGTFSYQWLRDGNAIKNASKETYALTKEDIGKKISVKVSYTDGAGNAESVTSPATAKVAEVKINTVPPVEIVEPVTPTPPVIEPPKTPDSKATEISDYLVGTINADKLNGLSGNDTIDAGNGNDVFSGNEDDDKLLGGNGDDSLSGDDGDDYLEGGAGNDTLDGGLGIDTMVGGDGDDTYYVDNIGDEIIESSSVKGGKDTVIITNPLLTRDNFSAFVGVENFVQLGENDTDIAGDDSANKLEGNAGNNRLIGNGGNDTLLGYAGDDTLEGGRGIDKLQGGAGNDTYILSNEEDTILDDEGIDIVLSSETITLKTYKNVENLTLTGNKTINGTGNDNANIIEGNDNDNKLDGVIGDDSLFGFGGDDTLIGGAGNNFLDGGNGEADVALYKSIASNYQIKSVDDVWTVIDIQNNTIDELKDIEFVQFSDKRVQLETLGVDSVPKISVQDVTLAEGNKAGSTKAKVVLTLDKPSTEEITVEVSTEDGTAIDGEDYEALNAETITFAAGVTKQTVNINFISDLISEEDENFFVKLGNPQNAEVQQVEATVVIANDDKPSLSIISAVSVTEGEKGKANAEILVSLSAPVSEIVTVSYKTTDGTAKSVGKAADFTSSKGTLTFKAGETSQKIIVPIIDDKLTEKNEAFTVTLSNASGALLDTSAAKSKITIVDNDSVAVKPLLSVVANPPSVLEGSQASFTVNLSAPSTKAVSVKFATADGSAKGGSDFEKIAGTLIFEAGETKKSVFVPVLRDKAVEGNETFSLKLSDAIEATLSSKSSAEKVTILDASSVTDSSAMMITTVGVSPEFA